MQIISGRKTIHAGYADRKVVKPPEWHSLVVWDVFFNGMTTGLFVVAVLAELCIPQLFKPISVYAYPVALVLLLIDLSLLVLDLGDPWRFHHMLRVFKPSSPMSLGTWCLTVYSLPLTAIVVVDLAIMIDWLPGNSQPLEWVRRIILAMGILPALGSAIYKGVLFSTSSQPGWKTARWLGGYLTNSALVLGCTEFLLLALIDNQPTAVNALKRALVVMLIIELLPLVLLAWELIPELAAIYSPARQIGLALISFLVGMIGPLILLAVPAPVGFMIASALGIFSGAWLCRYAIVMLPHHA